MRENQPEVQREAALRRESAYFMRETVCFFSYWVIAFAQFVRRHFGLLLKSLIIENGNAVIPIAPQQAKIGQPIKHNNPIKKHGKLTTIYTYSPVTICPSPSAIVMTQTGIKILPQKSHPTPTATPKPAMAITISTIAHPILFHHGSSSSLSQMPPSSGFNTVTLAAILKQTTNHNIIKLEPELRLEAVSNSKKRG